LPFWRHLGEVERRYSVFAAPSRELFVRCEKNAIVAPQQREYFFVCFALHMPDRQPENPHEAHELGKHFVCHEFGLHGHMANAKLIIVFLPYLVGGTG